MSTRTITRSVRDSAALLDATRAGQGAPYHAPEPQRPYLQEVTRSPGPLRIALQTETFNGAPTHPECRDAALAAAKLCESLGHHVEPVKLAIDAQALGRATQVLIASNVQATTEDAASALGRELGADLVETITFFMVQGARSATAADYARAIRTIHAVDARSSSFLTRYDVISRRRWPRPGGDRRARARKRASPEYIARIQAATDTRSCSTRRTAAMSVPLAWASDGMPLGVQFAARFGDEATLFRLAGQLEQAQPWRERRPPAAGR
jgi:Asp-tRNA(Asn)/Glu-tRNA(Gln) amidotransferase A subunit family amidase